MFLLDQLRKEAGFWSMLITVVSIVVVPLLLVRRRFRLAAFVFRGCICRLMLDHLFLFFVCLFVPAYPAEKGGEKQCHRKNWKW
jgi:hypothetical protein